MSNISSYPLRSLLAALDAELEPDRFSDYAPNGLQIEGRAEVRSVVVGVSANAELIAGAAQRDADALVVHHGFFWRNEPSTLVGVRRSRVAAVLAAEMSLIAYHLPLDAHPTIGNAAHLLDVLGFADHRPFSAVGRIADVDIDVDDVLEAATALIGPDRGVFSYGPRRISRIAVVTGGAAHHLDAAVAVGADLFITGEPAEMSRALAREHGVHFAAFGHHNTERFGPMALAEWIGRVCPSVTAEFVDVANPV